MDACNHKNNWRIAGRLLSAILSFLICITLDQSSKYYITHTMELYSSIPVIPDIFEIYYIRNAGAAWGMFQNQHILFYACTVVVLLFGCILYWKCLKKQSYTELRVVIILILSGAVGNFIDRIRYQYVIDFLYVRIIDFPVFNIADCYVTVGFFILLLLILFKYKESDFEQLFHK